MNLAALAGLGSGQLATIAPYLESCPVQIGELAREQDVAVRICRLDSRISGQVLLDPESGRYLIRINRREARQRQRFIIARGLAHFLLHRDIIDRSPPAGQC